MHIEPRLTEYFAKLKTGEGVANLEKYKAHWKTHLEREVLPIFEAGLKALQAEGIATSIAIFNFAARLVFQTRILPAKEHYVEVAFDIFKGTWTYTASNLLLPPQETTVQDLIHGQRLEEAMCQSIAIAFYPELAGTVS